MIVHRSFPATHAGARRSYNEDALVNRPDLGLWAVADGAGGHQAGEVASGMIRDALEAIPPQLGAGQLLAEARARLLAVHDSLRDEAIRRGPGVMMASTVVVLLVRDAFYAALSAGDSRIYLLRQGTLSQITRDHSLVQDLVDSGELTPEQAEAHPQSNIITRAVGAGEGALLLDKVTGSVAPGDRFLLCSDGLSKTLSDAEVAGLLAAPEGVSPSELLINAALARQVSDNVTVVVVEVL
jgi:protein phosphatase/serine/threonine-protein phosphatase Stp1